MSEREQQKLFLTPSARQRLREEAAARKCDMSDVVEHLIVKGSYPADEVTELDILS